MRMDTGRRLRRGAGFAWALVAAAGLCSWGGAQAAQGYLLGPDIHGDLVAFSAEGDLWTCSIDGQGVTRLTADPGTESQPRFSPDGRWIAFSGYYDGNTDVYVIPAVGGEPRRLTWHPGRDTVVGWTPDGEQVIFSSSRDNAVRNEELYLVPATGGEVRKLPLGRATYIDMDPETGQWAFIRSWGGGTWKRYRGGTAPEIWVGHPERADYHKVTDFDGIDAFPMWHAGRIYFLSDKGGTADIWSMRPDGTDRRRHTQHAEWDVRAPAMGPDGRIVFGLAGDIHVFDPADDSERTVPIDLPSERVLTRVRYPDTAELLTEAVLAPEGDRVAIVARGEIFSVPVKDGVALPITRGSGAREHGVVFDPKGERVAYITDAAHEESFVTADAWGRGEVKTIKPPAQTGWYFPPDWSPDGKWIAFADMTYTLYVMPADGGAPRRVDQAKGWEIREYVWSPDGRWLAYSKENMTGWTALFIYDVQKDETHQVTSWTTMDWSPTWDPAGRYLCFLSARTFNPMFSGIDFQTMLGPMTRPYLLMLRPDVKNPFLETEGLPPTDGAGDSKKDKHDKHAKKDKPGKGKDKDSKGEDEDEDKPVEPIEITFEGLADRWVELPVPAGNYDALAATEEKLFYLSNPTRGMAEEDEDEEGGEGPKGELVAFDFEKKEPKTFLSGVTDYELRAKAGKILISKGKGKLYVVDADSPPEEEALSEAEVSLDDVVIELDPRQEWEQIYHEAWRQLRDFYWDAGLHGLDWPAIRDQYASMLPRIATRDELRDLLAEMIGELSTSHTYTWGGDRGRTVPSRPTGLLGATLTRAGDAFRVERIYHGDPLDRLRSPLREPGADVKEGDYILAVNHKPFEPGLPFEANLENLAGKPVMLTVNGKPTRDGARNVVVKPLESEGELLYADWVRRNREYVAEKTDGRIGYIHIPDMGTRGLIEFDRWFYPQADKEGMVVDARWNGGGWVSQLILAHFERKILSWDRQRYGHFEPYPSRVLNGPFVVLTNEFAGSDGDIFPKAIQLAKLAPIIGMRSWGGVNGIRMNKNLVDGGMVTHPEFAWWDQPTGWGLEGHGVDPDIVVDDLPQELARGVDAQLDRGIEEVLRLHQERPPQHPEFGPAPDRSRKAYAGE
jgi:tricorn protease